MKKSFLINFLFRGGGGFCHITLHPFSSYFSGPVSLQKLEVEYFVLHFIGGYSYDKHPNFCFSVKASTIELLLLPYIWTDYHLVFTACNVTQN